MATITFTDVKCIRKQDLSGHDEPKLYAAGQEVWEGKIAKNETLHPNETRRFENSVLVELMEVDGKKEKLLGSWTVSDQSKNNKKLTASSSGYHYEVICDVK